MEDGRVVSQASSIRSSYECQTITFDLIVDCSKNRDAGCRAIHIPLKYRFLPEQKPMNVLFIPSSCETFTTAMNETTRFAVEPRL